MVKTASASAPQVADDTVKIAVMNNDIKHINETLGRLEGKFDAALNNFVTSDQLAAQLVISTDKHKEQDEKLQELHTAVLKLKERDDLQQGSIDANRRFVSVGLSVLAIAAVIIAGYIGMAHR